MKLLDAPSNLGLRPPLPGSVPGAYKLGWALREHGLVARLGATDEGVVVPPRYRAEWDGHTLRNREAIAQYSRRLADRIGPLVSSSELLVVLGGDCSILVGTALALRRRGPHGLVFVDGHLDFRHLGNSAAVGAAAGEDLALVTGRGSPDVTNLDGLQPYIQDRNVVAVGFRPNDECAKEVEALGMQTYSSETVRTLGAREVGVRAVRTMESLDVLGFWIHLDVDVLDSGIMPAVDTPEPNGLTYLELSELLRTLVASRRALGIEVTVFDPDLDDSGAIAGHLADALVVGLSTAPSSVGRGPA